MPPGTIYAYYTIEPTVVSGRQWLSRCTILATEISRHLDQRVNHGTNDDHVSVFWTLCRMATCLVPSDKPTELWTSLSRQIFFNDLYGTRLERGAHEDGREYVTGGELLLKHRMAEC